MPRAAIGLATATAPALVRPGAAGLRRTAARAGRPARHLGRRRRRAPARLAVLRSAPRTGGRGPI